MAEVLNSKKFDVIERKYLEFILNENNIEMSSIVDSESAAKVGLLCKVQGMMFGTIRQLGETVDGMVCKLQLRLVDVQDSSVVWADNISALVEDPDFQNKVWELECTYRLKDGKDLEGVLQKLENAKFQGSFAYGSLSMKYEDVDALLFQDGGSCQREGILFENGDFVSGVITEYTNGKFVVKNHYGRLEVNDNKAVAALCCKPSGLEEAVLERFKARTDTIRLIMKNGDTYSGELKELKNLRWTIGNPYCTCSIPQDRMIGATYIADYRFSGEGYGITMRNGDTVTGEVIAFDDTGLIVDTSYGQLQVKGQEFVAAIRFSTAGKVTPQTLERQSSEPVAGTQTSRRSSGENWIDPVTGMEWIPGGCYQMGSAQGHSDEQPVHEV